MTSIRFSFNNLTSEWYWIKDFHINGKNTLDKAIAGHLATIVLPFEELSIDDIKYKILKH